VSLEHGCHEKSAANDNASLDERDNRNRAKYRVGLALVHRVRVATPNAQEVSDGGGLAQAMRGR
jgi:hypothetical protein